MTSELAFLDAIRAAPDDDAPRLIYADWLSEHTSPIKRAQGEYIRCELALSSVSADSPERRSLEDATTALRERHRAAWEAPLTSLGAIPAGYERGLPCSLQLSSDAVFDHMPSIAELAPAWSDVHLHGYGDRFAQTMNAPLPPRVKRVQFTFNQHYPEVATLAASARDAANSPWLNNIETLLLRHNLLGEHAEPIVAAASRASVLRHLDLTDNELTADTARRLARHACFHTLESLALLYNNLDEGFGDLLDACRPSTLRQLRVSFGQASLTQRFTQRARAVGEAATAQLQRLLASPIAAVLTSLSFDGSQSGTLPRLFRVLDDLPSLQQLSVRDCGLSPEEFAFPPDGGYCGKLESLDLSSNAFDDTMAVALAHSPLCDHLRSLALASTQLTRRGVLALARSPRLAQLREIDLRSNRVGKTAERTLRESPYLKNLASVRL